ncbi:putative basic helix-loop-helix leucine zipper transcription factor [Helianthus annuus]|nr:putative basic helix-loop-helix leucine zipper transcription factor [Helianthus annuus]
MNSDPPVFDPGFIGEIKKEKEKRWIPRVEKPREVVHVRAKRGEATDSHSLAERGTNGHEAQMMERMVGEGYGDFPRFQSTWSP